ncbi:Cas4-like exonuclease [Sinorhizobium phage phiM5]|nr:Cas4-like exonuclease [Sinorhizobium phage phiM5]
MTSRHTKLFGSTSYRTLQCPAHYKRGANIPDPPSSEAAREGTMLHGYVEDVLRAPAKTPEDFPWWAELDFDQRNIVTTHVNLIREIAKEGRLYVEKRTESPHLHAEWFGTADAVIVKPPRLVIGDLKCGRIPVEVDDAEYEINAQLGSYAISVLENLKPSVRDQITEVELVIVQPREGGIKRLVVARDVLDNLKRRLLEAAALAESDNPPAAVGKACHFCKVKPYCETYRDFVHNQARLDFALEGGTADQLGLVELSDVLAVADMAIEWGKAVKARAEQILNDGVDIDGWQLIPKRAKRVWDGDLEALFPALKKAGLEIEDYMVPATLKSPAQIEAVLKERGIKLDLSDFTDSVSTGLKIAKIHKQKGQNDEYTGFPEDADGLGSDGGW